MQNKEVARYFDELANLLEIQGANPFRIRAYRNAARTLESLAESIASLAAESTQALTELPGIGNDLAEKIVEIVETGELEILSDLKAEIPPGVVEMLRIPNIGPKKVAVFFNKLNLTTLDELKEAAQNGRIAELKGFAKKTETIILEGIEQVAEFGMRTFLAEGKAVADEIVAGLLKLPGVKRASDAGSCRRRRETVGDLDVLVACEDSHVPMDFLEQHELVEKVLARGETKQRVRFKSGLEMDLRVVPDESFGAALQYFTGSKEHNIVIRGIAQKKGFKINEYGVFEDEKMIAGRNEEEVYATIGLPVIPPELRENRGEIELAQEWELPELVELKDMRGDLHMHTTASDGTASIREMADAAKKRKLKYIAITDHSKRVTMANGLDATRLRKHWKEIQKEREKISGIEVLCGIECDILEDATLDLADDVLAEADWVLAVLHYGLKQSQEKINKRLINAIRSPHVHAIGHPTGRLISRRAGADLSYKDVFQAAADYGVMMEINAHPSRLDLDDIHAAMAKDYGIPIVINTDAHSTGGLDVMQYGIYQARRAGLEKKDVANTLPFAQFRKLRR